MNLFFNINAFAKSIIYTYIPIEIFGHNIAFDFFLLIIKPKENGQFFLDIPNDKAKYVPFL